jgi:hypothetical protein
MTSKHVEALRRFSAASSEKIHTLSGYANVTPDREGTADPYVLSIVTYRASVRWIFGCVAS